MGRELHDADVTGASVHDRPYQTRAQRLTGVWDAFHLPSQSGR